MAGMVDKPDGYTELLKVFGNPLGFVNDKPAWEASVLETRPLPRPLLYAYAPALITRIRAHKLIVDHLVDCLMACLHAGVPPDRLHYGGCYCWRPKRTNSHELSVHTWGVAVDLEPAANPQGKPWAWDGIMLHPSIKRVFLDAGWTWGNDFPTPDPQHWQFSSGY